MNKLLPKEPWPVISIVTLGEMKALEPVILERIREVPNGGILYTLHPFRLLHDIGIDLAEGVIEALKDQQPRLCHLDEESYWRIRGTMPMTDVKVRIGRLFPTKVKA